MSTQIKKKSENQWHDYIGTSLRKTAEATLETAKRIAEYRASIEEDQFNKKMKEWFGFTPTNLSYWKSINLAIERFQNSVDVLPSSPRTLYELSGIKDELWDELVETRDIHPSITVENAKNLKTSGGIMRKISDKYAEANNYLEIMQSAKEIKDNCNTIKEFQKEFNKWLKDNPADFDTESEDDDIIEGEYTESSPKSESKSESEVPSGTSSATRAKCLALFGIYIDRPIVDKDVLTLLDKMAGNDETKLAAIETLEGE